MRSLPRAVAGWVLSVATLSAAALSVAALSVAALSTGCTETITVEPVTPADSNVARRALDLGLGELDGDPHDPDAAETDGAAALADGSTDSAIDGETDDGQNGQ